MAPDLSHGSIISRGCPHIPSSPAEFETVSRKLAVIGNWNVKRSRSILCSAKRRKIGSLICSKCDLTLSRPFACLHCSFSGCWNNGHVKEHLQESVHNYCADARTGSVFCSACDDFVYDDALYGAFVSAMRAAEEKSTSFPDAKKNREPFRPWSPNAKEAALLEDAIAIPCLGRRGLLNLGQTCFLNAILQSFVMNPLLRDHFLSDKHNHHLCKNKDCTCCEMDKLFGEIYSENTSPYGPTSFLATTWRASSELSGYAQQDAHEFFISALNNIHSTSRGSTKFQCICIVHSTFAGLLQSDVKCERCGNITTAADPMLDISLDLPEMGNEPTGQELTLASCLRKFTQPEKLGSNEYSCAKCGKASHDANKRLSIRKLPPVLSFQFKRFEHKSADKSAAHKIESPVRFPSNINMGPYTTLAMDVRSQESRDDGKTSSVLTPAMYEYDLFSVVCHEGQINNGHYTCFARSQDEWYRFDDDKVTHSSLGECLSSRSQVYMCFYVKRHLDYTPYVTPSYKITREAEAVREKEREREKEAARMREVEDALLATV
ncbi:cysteine proteinase [Laetiporus sulphureus 93-53]|uniref:Ubiquitin carboxyl-terminal hydrolase n=1 Tax=Laetiporus sulphureus 93-53 TaxID=1314785 RepID=A0A165CCQ5_9APHY|nr:cysteine proteinase [Laetiporus sulphureus 93-53]KZT02572.1 cysteine proteinase [Laetiporus sulphureus 93-53]